MGFSTKDYKTAFDREVDILVLECEIDTMTAINLFEESSALDSVIDDGYYTEEENSGRKEKVSTKIWDTILRIFTAMKKMVTNFIEMIGDIFSSKEKASASDIIHSETGQLRLSKDLKKLEEIVEKDALEGRKMIQLISKGTNIPDTTVAKFCDKGMEAVAALTPIMIPLALRFGFKEGFQKALGKTDTTIDKCIEHVNSVKNTANKVTEEGKKQCLKITQHMQKMQSELIKAGKDLFKKSGSTETTILATK